ncbi:MAG: hypothetical protein IFNCLDLE_02633 [Ignavibacteriaceae bacterium]|nr:hypothetical protein [Ignavibacteriaceae bacterium]
MKETDYKKLWRKAKEDHAKEHNELVSKLRFLKSYLESNKILTPEQTKDINKILAL